VPAVSGSVGEVLAGLGWRALTPEKVTPNAGPQQWRVCCPTGAPGVSGGTVLLRKGTLSEPGSPRAARKGPRVLAAHPATWPGCLVGS
jgi:hypothetical protein